MNTCETCRWWSSPQFYRGGRNADGTLYQYQLGICGLPRLLQGNPVRRIEHGEEPVTVKPDDVGVDYPPGDLRTNLYCGPKFGCVHHVPQ